MEQWSSVGGTVEQCCGTVLVEQCDGKVRQ